MRDRFTYCSTLPVIISVLLLANSYLSAQVTTEVAPLKAGNKWVYGSSYNVPIGDYIATLQYEVSDSTRVINGILFYAILYKETYSSGSDSSTYYDGVTPDQFFARYDTTMSDSLYTYFKMDPQKGDAWEQHGKYGGTIHNAIIDTFTAKVFNKYTLVYVLDRDAGLNSSREYWTKEFGMLNRIYDEGMQDIIEGCVIDGVLYGDTTFTGIDEVNTLPDKFVLYQNYPNPFNPTTTIKYEMPKAAYVRLVVYDILGREVATLVNEFKPGGRYSVTFNAGNLSSGIYIYQLRSGSFVANKKLVLLR